MSNKLRGYIKILLLVGIVTSFELTAKEWKGQWTTKAGKTLHYHIHVKDGEKASSVAFYLTNLKINRVGTDTDEAILSDLLERGFMTVNLDCSTIAGTSPQMEKELADFHLEMPQLLQSTVQDKGLFNLNDVYYLPAGYSITKNLPYWNTLEHGANGTAEHIVKMYNRYAAQKHKVPRVKTIDEIKGKKGESIDYNMRMEIVYPTGTLSTHVPLMVNFSTQSQRMRMFSGNPERIIYPLGFLLSGYAWANVDHGFVTTARDEYYGFIRGEYSLDKWNGLASSSAAIRFLRANAVKYNLNEKIGAMGISKAAYAVMRLADAEHANLTELATFDGFEKGSPSPQPFAGISSKIDVGYTSAGWDADYKYITKTTIPLAMSAGKFDKFRKWDSFPKFISTFEEMNTNYLAFWMEDIGHTYPVGKDFASGQSRYVLLKKFFDAHLQSSKELEVLYILPSDGNQQVLKDGYSHHISPEVAPPSNMEGVSVYSPITIRFSDGLASSRGGISPKNVKVVNMKTQKEVNGDWRGYLKNTRFEFLPVSALEAQTEYMITVTSGIKSRNGKVLQKEIKSRFKTK